MENEKPRIKFKKEDKASAIHADKIVKVTQMKHIIEVLSLEKESQNLAKYRKLNKSEYVELETGEIFEYKLNENRGQNIAGVKKTLKSIRGLINNNFVGGNNELFVTLTYRPNEDGTPMTDTKRLYSDFDKFTKRLKYKYPDIDYLSIIEPQGWGAWHCHVLIKFNDRESVFIANNDELQPMWGHGFTKIKRINNVDNIGAYFSAYLADMEISEENRPALQKLMIQEGKNFELVKKEFEGDNGEKVTKKFLKGARLHLYPSGINIYRSSKGIIKPETVEMTYAEAKEIVGSREANYSRTITISGEDTFGEEKHFNSITYEQYNLIRKKTQE